MRKTLRLNARGEPVRSAAIQDGMLAYWKKRRALAKQLDGGRALARRRMAGTVKRSPKLKLAKRSKRGSK